MKPLGIEVPDAPGKCHFRDGTLINRMNRTQASIWNLSNPGARMPGDSAYTDLTDATVCLALFGPKAFGVVEKLSALDVLDPGRPAPFLLQGPFAHVPCQLAVLEKGPGAGGGLVFTCSRGYAESMVHAVLAAGAEFGLKPAGERRFTDWLAGSGRNG
jgi:glycine cleavage system aminomethyltransferase T